MKSDAVGWSRWIATASQVALAVLFTYSGILKATDTHSFYKDVSASPFFNPSEINVVVRAVISSELLISILLCFRVTRILGLYGALFSMVAYSTYLIFLYNFFESRPCGCGGVFGSLGYRSHIALNLIFVALAVWGCLHAENDPLLENGWQNLSRFLSGKGIFRRAGQK